MRADHQLQAPINPAARADAAPVPFCDEERIVAYIKEHDSINNAECRNLLQVEIQRASNLLRKMHKQRLLKRDGERRWARYTFP